MKSTDIVRLLALSAIWGASFLFIRIGAPVLGPLPAAFFRVLIGAVTLAACLVLMRVHWDMRGKWRAVMTLGVINSGIPFVMYAVAALWLPAGYSAVFNAMTPLMGVLIGALFFAEPLTRAKAIGVVLGLLGVAVLTRTGPVTFSPMVLLGAAACLVATLCYGLAGFLTRRWITAQGGLDNRLVAAGSLIGATLFLLPFSAAALIRENTLPLAGPGVWAAMLALGMFCTAIAYVMYFRLIADIGPVRSLTVTFLIPPFGIVWGWIFLGETLSAAHAVGMALIGGAVWMVLRPAKPAAQARTA
ncbi:DMT family transporter [Cupriavidus plantarum]|uniref:Threonine/homoserine efflux transporter RhtA n=1 Tax=Cupriavidus plantarum TaxID=942865 RepID=A0A316EP11_9BURK|nr:DMT family transporter [Cupriavidus plantarum]NYI02276.1 drug/metabolite transporter (DMT)-like permease [Cupriavidus plantarum]PWK33067.1 threonine/homoserine efflux transporter RhtA [Cupriavidus plantarum]CAG2146324.1 IS1595 family transposase ISBsp7 [Cupriavidus plantarum]SMR86180.1 Threonine/homoserine efflux transporter RhtA [Cupriavidus plantarum]